MTYEVIKTIKGNRYRYLVKSVREGDRVRQVFVRYLGRAGEGEREPVEAEPVEREVVERPVATAPIKETPVEIKPTPEVSNLEAEKAVQELVNELRTARQQRLDNKISQKELLERQGDIAQRAIDAEPLDIAKETWRGILYRTETELAGIPDTPVPVEATPETIVQPVEPKAEVKPKTASEERLANIEYGTKEISLPIKDDFSDYLTLKELSSKLEDGLYTAGDNYVYSVEDGKVNILPQYRSRYDYDKNKFVYTEREVPPEDIAQVPIFHGSVHKDLELTDLSLERTGQNFAGVGGNEFAGIYFTTRPSDAKGYASLGKVGGTLIESRISPDAKVIRYKDVGARDTSQLLEDGVDVVLKYEKGGDIGEVIVLNPKVLQTPTSTIVPVEKETPAPAEPTPEVVTPPVEPKPTPTPVTKEPWEMTKAERATYIEQKGKESIQKWNESGSKGFPPSNPERWGVSEVNKAADELGMPWGEGRVAIPQHKYEVMVALKQGQPIPPEVLKDYPELKPTTPVETKPAESIREGDKIKDTQGREWTVLDASDPSKLRVESPQGVSTSIGRKTVEKVEAVAPEVAPVTPEVIKPEEKLGFREWQRKYGKNISDELDEIAWRRYYFKEPAIPKTEVARASEIAPVAPEVTEANTELQRIVDKWSASKTRSAPKAEADLASLEQRGFEIADAKDALQEYKDTDRADFDTAEDFSEARTEAWENFTGELEGIGQPVTPTAPAVEPTPLVEEKPEEIKLSSSYDSFKVHNAPTYDYVDEHGEDRIAYSPEAYTSDYMTKSSDTSRNLRWVYVLNDGSEVSLESYLKIKHPNMAGQVSSGKTGFLKVWSKLDNDERQTIVDGMPWDDILPQGKFTIDQYNNAFNSVEKWLIDNKHPLAPVVANNAHIAYKIENILKTRTTEKKETYTTTLPSGLEVITPEDTARQIADVSKEIQEKSQEESLKYWRDKLEKQTATISRWREQLKSQGKTEEQINRVIPEGSEVPKDMPENIREQLLPEPEEKRPYPMSPQERRRAILESHIKRGEPVPDKLLAEFPDLKADVSRVKPEPPEDEESIDTALRTFEEREKARIPTREEYLERKMAEYKSAIEGAGFPLDVKKQTEIINKEYDKKYPTGVSVKPEPEPTPAYKQGSALDRYKRGLITRDEYLSETGLIDVSRDKTINKMLSMADKHQWAALKTYLDSIQTEEEWMKDDIIDMLYDARQLARDDPQGDLPESLEGLKQAIRDFEFPVPQKEAENETQLP